MGFLRSPSCRGSRRHERQTCTPPCYSGPAVAGSYFSDTPLTWRGLAAPWWRWNKKPRAEHRTREKEKKRDLVRRLHGPKPGGVMRTQGAGRCPKSNGTNSARHRLPAGITARGLICLQILFCQLKRKTLHWKVLRTLAARVSDKRPGLSAATPQPSLPQPLARTNFRITGSSTELYSETASLRLRLPGWEF